MLDISTGGMRISREGAVNVLSSLREVDFRLALPAGGAFQLKGSLKYELESENCACICFERLTEEQREAITEYILARVREIQKRM